MMIKLTDNARAILALARQVYGDRNQISVSIEELCELAAALSKFIRYDQTDAIAATREKVIDEYADVVIVLDHVYNVYNMTKEEVQERITRKTDRLSRWLQESTAMEQTTIDRSV